MKKALFSLLIALMLIPCVAMAQKPTKDGVVVVTDTTVCDSMKWDITGLTYYANTVEVYRSNDTSYVLNLTVGQSISVAEPITASCDYSWHGSTYSNDTTVIDTLTTSMGCDSIVTLTLNLSKLNRDTLSVVTCHDYSFRGESYNITGYYSDTTTNESLACDSIFVLNLTMKDTITREVVADNCSRYTWTLKDSIYTASTIDTVVIEAENAETQCDTMVVLTLTIGTPVDSTISATYCRSFAWGKNDSTYTETTTDVYTVVSSRDDICDTVFTLNIEIIDTLEIATIDSACSIYKWDTNTYTATTTDTVYHLTSDALTQCDTMMTLDITIFQKADTIQATACDSYTIRKFNDGRDSVITVSDTYLDTIADAKGCKTYRVHEITINPTNKIENTIDTARCTRLAMTFPKPNRDTFLVYDANTGRTIQGRANYAGAQWTFETDSRARVHYAIADGTTCLDSTVNVNVTIYKTSSDVHEVDSCGRYTWVKEGTKTVDSTHYNGYDSVIFVQNISDNLIAIINGEDTVNAMVTTDAKAESEEADTIFVMLTDTTSLSHDTLRITSRNIEILDSTKVEVEEATATIVNGEDTTDVFLTTVDTYSEEDRIEKGVDTIIVIPTVNTLVNVEGENTMTAVYVALEATYADSNAATFGADTIVVLNATTTRFTHDSTAYDTTTVTITDTTFVKAQDLTVTISDENDTTVVLFTTDEPYAEGTDMSAVYAEKGVDTIINLAYTYDTTRVLTGGIDTTITIPVKDTIKFTKNGRDSVRVGVNEFGCDSFYTIKVVINKFPIINSIEGKYKVLDGQSAELYAVMDSSEHKTYRWYYTNKSGNEVTKTADTLKISSSDINGNTDVRLEVEDNKTRCTAESWITVLYGVGIADVEDIQMSVYPNPAAQIINLKSGQTMTSVVIYNTLGMMVASKQIDGTAATLDLTGLSQGTYTMQVLMANGQTVNRRFVKMK